LEALKTHPADDGVWHPSRFILAILICVSSFAAEPKIYTPVGAPPSPKVEARWDVFRDYAAATELLRALAKAHPDRCGLETLGKSYGGREMWVMTITNEAGGKADSKPGMWVDGGIHANEVQTTDVVLYTAWFLLEMDGKNAAVTDLLKRRTFYLLPMMSPDSRDAHLKEPNNAHSPRGGQRPVVAGEEEGNPTGAKDLDGDGQITQMRIADPNGRWKPHPEFPQLMVRVKDNEKGSYTLLGDEGTTRDDDEDRSHRRGAYDPNRDWPWQWEPDYVQHGAVRYPLWVGENRMAADYIEAHPNIGGAVTFHNAAGMIIRSPGAPGDSMEPRDVHVFDAIGQKGELILPGYKYIELRGGLYPGYGVEMDWLYAMRGVVAYTVELYTPFNMFRRASEGLMGTDEDLHLFNKYLLMDDAFVPWHAVDHPKYGKIEVGGFKKNYVRQPAAFLVEEECHRNMAFVLEEARQLAQVRVQSVAVKELGGGVHEVTAIIENEGEVPTRLAADVKHHVTPADRASISGAGLKVITGLVSRDRFFEEATEQKRRPAELRIESVHGKGIIYVRWLVTGGGPWTVTAASVKGGSDSMSVVAGGK
jgi:hypothetical protein